MFNLGEVDRYDTNDFEQTKENTGFAFSRRKKNDHFGFVECCTVVY